jgi:O-antigen/teichoic acid export membrane protein
MVVAGVFDYATNILAGRGLDPIEFGTYIAVMAIVQVAIQLSVAIRMVVAFYTAEQNTRADSAERLVHFYSRVWRWACKWGAWATAALVLAAPFFSHLLQLPNSWPLWAASPMILLLFLRESNYGVLQGTELFTGLGVVQVLGAVMRFVLAGAFIWLGWQAPGAIVAQPLGTVVIVALTLWWLRGYIGRPKTTFDRPISWHYSAATLLGLAGFGLLTNLDVLFVKHYFSPEVAGHYGPVATLSKVCLFLPWAVGIVLFPKVTRRQASGKDPRPILLLSLGAALLPGLGITALYFLFHRMLVGLIFTGAYGDPGIVLGLVSLAATLHAGLFIWLNYSLSLERRAFVYALLAVLAWQGLGMYLFGRDSLVHMALVMVSSGMAGNLAGFATNWTVTPATKSLRAAAVSE